MSDNELLKDMLFNARQAVEISEQVGLRNLRNDRRLRELLFEYANKVDVAASQVSEETRLTFSRIDWVKVVGGSTWFDYDFHVEHLYSYAVKELRHVKDCLKSIEV